MNERELEKIKHLLIAILMLLMAQLLPIDIKALGVLDTIPILLLIIAAIVNFTAVLK